MPVELLRQVLTADEMKRVEAAVRAEEDCYLEALERKLRTAADQIAARTGQPLMDAAEIERKVVATSAGGDGPELGGPVLVLDTAKGADGGSTYHVSASYLVPIDEDDPDLAGVSIAVPVTATVEIDGEGAIVGIDVPVDAAAQREARSFTRNLIARGAVSGLAASGPVRRGPGLAHPPTTARN